MHTTWRSCILHPPRGQQRCTSWFFRGPVKAYLSQSGANTGFRKREGPATSDSPSLSHPAGAAGRGYRKVPGPGFPAWQPAGLKEFCQLGRTIFGHPCKFSFLFKGPTLSPLRVCAAFVPLLDCGRCEAGPSCAGDLQNHGVISQKRGGQ